MTELELRSEIEGHASVGNIDAILGFAKAYAASEVSKAIEPLDVEMKDYIRGAYKKVQAELAAKDAEIAGLQMQIRVEGAVNNREITRLREGIQAAYKAQQGGGFKIEDLALQSLQVGEILQALLSPSEEPEKPAIGADGEWIGDMDNTFDQWVRLLKSRSLTVRDDGGNPFEIRRVGDVYESNPFSNYDLKDVIDWVSTHGGLEFYRALQPKGKGEGV